MAHEITVAFTGDTLKVDGRDVAAWLGIGSGASFDPEDGMWQAQAARYVEAHPRAPSGTPGAQRMLLARRLAAGRATTQELLAVLRQAGWVGASDLENRLRDLRAGDLRAGNDRGALPLESEAGVHRLTEPFAMLDATQRRALGFVKAMMSRLDGPLALQALAALDGLLPNISRESGSGAPAEFRAGAAALERFHAAMADRRPVRCSYFSLNSGLQRSYELVPVEYVAVGPVVKALCVEVGPDGDRRGIDRQFALDRLVDVTDLPEWQRPAPETIRLRRSDVAMEVSDGLYQVMLARNLFGIRDASAEQIAVDAWRVNGSFPVALAWDVMEQLCAWAGNVQVHEPLWLVNAVCRRLRAGLRVMEEGRDFVLIKPDIDRSFASHGEAVMFDDAETERSGPRKLPPRRQG